MPHLSTKKRSRRAQTSAAADDDAPRDGRMATSAENLTATLPGGSAPSSRRPASEEMRKAVARTLARFTPMHIVIDGDHEIVHLHGNAGRYLELAPGSASFSLPRMLREGLERPLEGALLAAGRAGATVRKRNVKVRTNNGLDTVDLEVTPIRAERRKDWFLIVFESVKDSPRKTLTKDTVSRLRKDLAEMREALRQAIHQQELTNGELKSANEDVQSANEELQVINEELETSRHLLQEHNDELQSVNAALLQRGTELAALNTELGNILASLQLAVVIVDSATRIKRYTARAQPLYRLRPGDIGRPLLDITPCFTLPNLHREIKEVLETGTPKRLQASGENGNRFSLRLFPLSAEDDAVEGVSIVTIDLD